MQALALLLVLAPLAARAQLSSVPNLSTATESTTAQTTGKTTQTTNGGTNTQKTNNDASSTDTNTFKLTDAPKLSTGSSSSGGLANPTGTFTNAPVHLTGLPTIAGAGIPTLVIPFTANAPFMQKSSLPEGTFFIAVGAVLAFLGACVLLWRLLVAWSINRSVRRTAAASMQLNEKSQSGSYWRSTSNNNGYNRVSTGGKGSLYKDVGGYSNVSLDNLTSAGKTSKPHFRDSVTERHTSSNAPPPTLFFSPTAQAAQQRDSVHRNSGYMPSGFYASPAAAQAGAGLPNTTTGGLAPGHGHSNRYSGVSMQSGPSPPPSPSLPPQSRGSTLAPRDTTSRDGLRAPPSRDGLSSNRNSAYMYAQPSSSSLFMGGSSVSDLPGSRAPSAYLEELFDNHGNGPRERF
jgi:hypothetical protein